MILRCVRLEVKLKRNLKINPNNGSITKQLAEEVTSITSMKKILLAWKISWLRLDKYWISKLKQRVKVINEILLRARDVAQMAGACQNE